jgi:hypothetical protein
MRPQFQQPLSAEILSQQQQMIKQLQHHQTTGGGSGMVGVGSSGGISVHSPKRVELNSSNRQQLLSQTIIHQTYGVQQPTPQQPMAQSHILSQYQNQQSTNVAANLQLRQISASSVIPSNYSTSSPSSQSQQHQQQQQQQQQVQVAGISISPQSAAVANNNNNRNLACLPMSYYTPQPHFVGDQAIHSTQVRFLHFDVD